VSLPLCQAVGNEDFEQLIAWWSLFERLTRRTNGASAFLGKSYNPAAGLLVSFLGQRGKSALRPNFNRMADES